MNVVKQDSKKRIIVAELLVPTCSTNSPSSGPAKNPTLLPSIVLSSIPSNTPSAKTITPPFKTHAPVAKVCNVKYPDWLGDGVCNDADYGYYTPECNWDEGDCDKLKALFPLCPGPFAFMGDGVCDEYPPNDKINCNLNIPECGYDLGDCNAEINKSDIHISKEKIRSKIAFLIAHDLIQEADEYGEK